MKKLLFGIMSLLFLFSCSKDDEPSDFSQEDINKRQSYGTNFDVITPCEASGLTYFVDENCDNTDYQDAIAEVIEKYNQAGTSIHFSVASSEEEADLIIRCVDVLSCTSGSASTPWDSPFNNLIPDKITTFDSGGKIGGELWLGLGDDDSCNCESVINSGYSKSCLYQSVVIHEMMHILGFHHNESFGIQVPGTFEPVAETVGYDPGSVINSGSAEGKKNEIKNWCKRPCDFNENDLTALRCLYPPIDHIEVPNHICINESFTACIEYAPSNCPVNTNHEEYCETYEFSESGTQFIKLCNEEVEINVLPKYCSVPFEAPLLLNTLCYYSNPEVCIDLSFIDCLKTVKVKAPGSFITVEVSGTQMCVEVNYPIEKLASIEVTPVGHCGGGLPEEWIFSVNDGGC